MKKFYVTFGVMYADRPHPSVPGAHPDSLMEILAKDEMTARRAAFGLTNGHFSMIHTEEEMDRLRKDWGFARGICMRITVEEIETSG